MEPVEIASYRIRINQSKGDLNQVVHDLLLEEDIPVDLLPHLIQALKPCAYIEELNQLLVKTRSTELLAAVRNKRQRPLDCNTITYLLHNGFPDPQIENEAIDELEKCYRDSNEDRNPTRCSLARAMKENGGKHSLQTLEAIAYELEA